MFLAVHYQVMKYLGSLESTQEARVALGCRLGQLLHFSLALQTSCVLHNSIVHAKAWTNYLIGLYSGQDRLKLFPTPGPKGSALSTVGLAGEGDGIIEPHISLKYSTNLLINYSWILYRQQQQQQYLLTLT